MGEEGSAAMLRDSRATDLGLKKSCLFPVTLP